LQKKQLSSVIHFQETSGLNYYLIQVFLKTRRLIEKNADPERVEGFEMTI